MTDSELLVGFDEIEEDDRDLDEKAANVMSDIGYWFYQDASCKLEVLGRELITNADNERSRERVMETTEAMEKWLEKAMEYVQEVKEACVI